MGASSSFEILPTISHQQINTMSNQDVFRQDDKKVSMDTSSVKHSKRSKKYTLNDLNKLRNLSSCRTMPTNVLCVTEIISPGLGLATLGTMREIVCKQAETTKNEKRYKNDIKSATLNKMNQNNHLFNIYPSAQAIKIM